MKLTYIEIRGFGCLKNYTLTPEDGINTVSLPQGGKTTLISFLNAFFGGFSGGARNYLPDREKSFPWHSGAFGGRVFFDHGDKSYKADITWSSEPSNDVLYLSENGSEPVLYTAGTVLADIIGIKPENIPLILSDSFSEDLTVSLSASSGTVCPDAGEASSSASDNPGTLKRALDSVRAEKAYISGGEVPGALELLKDLKSANDAALKETEEGESRILELSGKISYNEKLLEKYSDDLTPDKAIEAVRTSTTITAKNARVQSLQKIKAELEENINVCAEKERKIRIPFTILVIILMCLTLFACILCVSSGSVLGNVGFLKPVSTWLSGKMPYSVAISGISFILLAVILVAICTGKSKKLRQYEERLYRVYYSLCDAINFGNFEPIDFDSLGDEADNVLEEKIESLSQDAASAESFIETTARTFDTIFKHEGEKAAIKEEIISAKSAMDLLSAQLSSRDSYTDLLERDKEIADDMDKVSKKLETLNKAEEILLKAAKRMRLSFLPELSQTAGAYLSKWTDGKYTAISVSPSYGICVYDGEVFRNIDCFGESIDYLVSLALHVSVLKILASDGRDYPLLLDNPCKIINPETLEIIKESLDLQVIITGN